MADKITIPAQGTGDATPDVATESIGAKHYQLMKLVSGVAGSAVTVEAGSGTSAAALRVVHASDSPLPAGSNSIGTVSAGLLAGSASIGSVNVLALPVLPAGSNSIGTVSASLLGGTASIGSVNVLALPALPAGANSIGSVNVLALPALPAGSNSIGTVSATLLAGTASIGSVNVLSLPSLPAGASSIGSVNVLVLPALVAGSASIGTVSAGLLAGSASIGSVNVLVLPALPAGSNSIGTVSVTLLAGTNTNEVVGDVAADAAIAGNPIVTGAVTIDTDDTAPPNRATAEARAVRAGADRDGSVYVRPHGPQVWSFHTHLSTALTDATVHASPGAGLSLYVTDIVVSSGAATAMNVFFEEGSTTVLGPYYLEAISGRGMAIRFATPKKVTAATALTVTTSAAIAHAVDVMGYTAQG
jgi:hypothetical protein